MTPTAEAKFLDESAIAAMAALIAKIPLHDRKGEHGLPAPTIEEIHQVRVDVARSAYDYAFAMLHEKRRRLG